MNTRSAARLDACAAEPLRQSRKFQTVTEWADAKREIVPPAKRTGKWRTDEVPYLRGIMDACSFTHPCHKVVVQKGNQIGVTEAAVINVCGYTIESWPGPILLVIPADKNVDRYVSSRFRRPLAKTPSVLSRLGETEGDGEGVNTTRYMTFPGGQIVFQGSKAEVREMPVSVGIVDDADACQRNAEGDIVALVALRSVTYAGRRKTIVISTPTRKGTSVIEREYEHSSQNRYHIPCPECGVFAPLEWKGLVWPKDRPELAQYCCSHCGKSWPESEKLEAMRHGFWQPDRPEYSNRVEGFLLPAFYSPFRRWAEIAHDWLVAKRVLEATGDATKTEVSLNCDRAETFVPPDEERLEGVELAVKHRREPPYDPAGLPLIVRTGGADAHPDRIEATAWGWAAALESYFLEHARFKGSLEHNEVWDALKAWAIRFQLKALCVDESAYTQTVRNQVERLVLPLAEAGCLLWGRQGHERGGPDLAKSRCDARAGFRPRGGQCGQSADLQLAHRRHPTGPHVHSFNYRMQ